MHARLCARRLLTSSFIGDVLTAMGVVPVLAMNFLPDEGSGSFLGEILTFVGVADLLPFEPASCSSFFFFMVASLELTLTGAASFLGVGPIASSDALPLRLVFEGLPESLRAWMATPHRVIFTDRFDEKRTFLRGIFASFALPSLREAPRPAWPEFWQIPRPHGPASLAA